MGITKKESSGNEIYKARLVAKGFSQNLSRY